jgi:spectinomycin phosphotransferase
VPLVAARQCTVKSRPTHLADEVIGAVVTDGWGLHVAELRYLPVGGGAYHWSALADDGRRWFVTCDDLLTKPWLGSDADTVFEALASAYRATTTLRDAGLSFVAAPIVAPSGTPVIRLDERHSVSVSEQVDGKAGQWGHGLPASRREELVTMLARLHLTTAPGTIAVRALAVPGRAELDAALDDLGRPWDGGPFSELARCELEAHADVVTQAVAELDRLTRRLGVPDGGLVVTHGEPHPGNLIDTNGGLVLIDWDTVAVARPERDLWMIDDPDVATTYRRLTGIRLERAALASYRLLWALTDVAAFTVELRGPHRGDADGEHALLGLRKILSGAEPAPYGRFATRRG